MHYFVRYQVNHNARAIARSTQAEPPILEIQVAT